jgi:hypothetical protein
MNRYRHLREGFFYKVVKGNDWAWILADVHQAERLAVI